jgi:ribosomal peptide maturation radical SAM protein 1
MVILGGPNCEYPMGRELLNNFNFIDAICSGEGESAFISVLEYLKNNKTTCLHKNMTFRKGDVSEKILLLNSNNKVFLDELPFVDYDDYFFQMKNFLENKKIKPRVLLETSRGCWWGEKSHCTFCGLNGSSMEFRSKSPKRALSEIKEIKKKYPNTPISVVDNIIDYKYFDTLLVDLAEEEVNVELFYETKANLKKEQLIKMRKAGITRIQPGIESLSSNVLKIMKKGVKSIQNICLLKWCIEEGIKPEWNLLCGFPNEDHHDYEIMYNFMPSIFHLTPPCSSSVIRLDRYSPLYEDRDNRNIKNVRPYSSYYEIYDIPEKSIEKIAYYFEFDYTNKINSNAYIDKLIKQTKRWSNLNEHAYLIYFKKERYSIILDGRVPDEKENISLPLDADEILMYLESPRKKDDVNSKFNNYLHQKLLKYLIDKRIILELDGMLFNLAINLSNSFNSKGLSAFLTDMTTYRKTEKDKVAIPLNTVEFE